MTLWYPFSAITPTAFLMALRSCRPTKETVAAILFPIVTTGTGRLFTKRMNSLPLLVGTMSTPSTFMLARCSRHPRSCSRSWWERVR